MSSQATTFSRLETFERVTRQIRWATLAVVLVTFPPSVPHAKYVYIALLCAALYNLLRYIKPFHRSKIASSPALMLVIDGVFVAALIAAVGDISTPYSAFLVFMIVSAAYLYQIYGVILVTIVEAVALYLLVTMHFNASVELDSLRTIVVTVYALVSFGYMVSRLTQYDRELHETLAATRIMSEQQNSRLITLVNSLHTAIIVTDHKGRVVQHNEAARILANGVPHLDGEKISEVMPFFKRSDPQKKQIDIFENLAGAQHRRDLCILTNEDVQVDLDISVTRVEVFGRAPEYILVCEDISKERSLEEQRTGFISVTSHELRTPIAILEGALSSLLRVKETIPPKVLPLVEQAHRSADQLSKLVKDLSILAEAQNDNVPINLTHIDATQMLSQCVADFSSQATQLGLELEMKVAEDTPSVLSTESHIREILQNYITNAFKYTPKGVISIQASPAKNGGILFSVQDSGIGISIGDQKMLFTKFFRAENHLTQKTGGTGLGLYLCMELAERLNAKVWAKSAQGKGSTFYLEIPPQSLLKRDQSEVVTAEVENLVDGI